MSASSSRPKVNLRSTAVKRIMQEASELSNPAEDDFVAAPLEVSSVPGFGRQRLS
jgi:ubiquitin-conjugating enzyme E2 J1